MPKIALPALLLCFLPLLSTFTARAEAQTGCVSSESELCLNQGRFQVTADWTTAGGDEGDASAVPFFADDSGMLWFFDEDNWEVLTKVIDGCAINGHYWVFSAATTDVGFNLRVTDTVTGRVKTYSNAVRTPAETVVDTSAFAQCSAGRASEPAPPKPLRQSRTGITLAETRSGQCFSEAANLCLNEGRFDVQVRWKTVAGDEGVGRVVPFGSPDTGLFWFFQENNWEMMVKVLDGCPLNDRYWVFSAATTDVEYTLAVTDTVTGVTKEYFNPAGTAAAAVTDTDALAVCGAQPEALPRVEFTSGRAVTLAGQNDEMMLEVSVFDVTGQPVVNPAVEWMIDDGSLISVTDLAPGRALVTALADTPGSAIVTASFQGGEATAGVAVVKTRPNTSILSSSTIVSRSGSQLELESGPETDILKVGDIIFNGDAGVADRIESIDNSGPGLMLSTEKVPLPEVFEEIRVGGVGRELFLRIELNSVREGTSTLRDASGRVLSQKVLAPAGDFPCRAETGGGVAVTLVGAEIVSDLRFTLPWGYESTGSLDDFFFVTAKGDYNVSINAGSLEFKSSGSLKFVCDKEIATFLPVQNNPTGIGATLGLSITPVIGVEVDATVNGPSLTFSGPSGSISGSLEAGLIHTGHDGYEGIWEAPPNKVNGTSPKAGATTLGFSVGATAFAKLDMGLLVRVGIPPFTTAILDDRMTEVALTLGARTGIEIPLTPRGRGYTGPKWDISTGIAATLKLEHKGNFGEFLEILGMPTSSPFKFDLFKATVPLLQSPQPVLKADDLSAGAGFIDFEVTGAKSGRFDIWRNSGGLISDKIASGALIGGTGQASWEVDQLTEGTTFLATMESDSLSKILPYASAALGDNRIAHDFDSAGSPYEVASLEGPDKLAPLPAVVGPQGPSSGRYLNLLSPPSNPDPNVAKSKFTRSLTGASFDAVTTGTCSKVVADFDFRMTCKTGKRTGFNCANGLSYSHLNQVTYGAKGAVVISESGAAADGPGGSLSVGFLDFAQGTLHGNTLMVTYNNDIIGVVDVPFGDIDLVTGLDAEFGAFHHARVTMDYLDIPSPSISVELTDGTDGSVSMPFNEFPLPVGADLPYPGRAGFGARTGDAHQWSDIDNVQVTYSNCK